MPAAAEAAVSGNGEQFRLPTNGRASQLFLILVISTGLAAYGGLVRLHLLNGTLRDQVTPQTIGWFFLAFAAYGGMLLWAERRPVSMRWVWAGAISFRLLLLFTTPTLSDDVNRYMWEGRLVANSVSPYAHVVSSPVLDSLDIPIRTEVNNPWMASPYLPVAHWVFGLLARLFPLQPLFFQVGMLAFELLGAALIASLLGMAGLPRSRLILYLWNPLVVLEVAHAAHLEALMLFLLLAAIWTTWRFRDQAVSAAGAIRRLAAPFLLALATLTKILPVLLLAVFFWRWSWVQRLFYGLVVAVVLVPYALDAGWGLTGPLDGVGVFGAARIYAEQWSFNSGLFFFLEQSLIERGVADAGDLARNLMLGGLVSVMFVIGWRARSTSQLRENLRLASIPFMAYLLLTTTVHPWYALSLLAFLPFLAPARDEPGLKWLHALPWIYLSAALITSYLTYLDPLNYGELPWVRRIEWYPTWVLLALGIWLNYRRWRRPPRDRFQTSGDGTALDAV